MSLKKVFIFIFLFSGLLLFIFFRKPSWAKLGVAYGILTTGFFAMSTNLILIFSFQIAYGYLYYKIGLLISIFMAGIFLGSLLVTNGMEKLKNHLRFFLLLDLMTLIFSFLLGLKIGQLTNQQMPLLFFAGFLVGVEFPLASHLYLKDKNRFGSTAGVLYSADLMGGWLAGILTGVAILPLFGLAKTCMIIAGLKLSSILILFSLWRKKFLL